MKPIVGQAAPLFQKTDSDGQLIDLNARRGKKIVLYFYPKDDTPGCTAQACNLNENLDKLQADGFVVIGVSIDSDAAHIKFKKKYQ
jgi:peroxiredoxin Q/BCP